MEKIAIISDVHGNLVALKQVLDDIKSQKLKHIFCLGDLFLAGYNPNYIGEKILELKDKMNDNFEIIQGNTDKIIANVRIYT